MQTWMDFDDAVEQHGKDAVAVFERFKETPPTEEIDRSFIDRIIAQLPDGTICTSAEWGLESPESDHYAEWCCQFCLEIPSIEGEAFIEVGDYHYFVSLDTKSGFSDGETVKYQDHIVELLLEWIEQSQEEEENA